MTTLPPSPVYEFGDFRMDVAERQLLRRDGTAVPLTPRVFDTLRYLVENGGRLLDKEVLMEAVWPDSIVEENNLTQNISALRRAFGEIPGSQHYIVTVPGHGYRFVPEVRQRKESAAQPNGTAQSETGPVKAPADGEPRSTERHLDLLSSRQNLRPILFAVLALLGLGLAVLFFWGNSRTQTLIPTPARTLPTALAIPEKSIAVLPFANLSADQENAFFAEGMQDDILTALAKVAELKVIARTSVMNYPAGPQRDLREIGQALAVAKILEGSVRRAGGKVRVTVQLIDTRTNTHVWAETYDRDLMDVFAIQSEIAQAIAAQLQTKLSPGEKSAIADRPTQDLVAYDLYLRAKALYQIGWNGGPKGAESLLEAASLLDQAIARDPEFFLAYCQLARTHGSLYFMGMDRTPARLVSAETAIAAAARLRSQSGEVHLLRAENRYHVLDYDRARAELALAQRTLPNEPRVFRLLAQLDRRQGRWEEAVRSYKRAMELDPRDSSYLRHMGSIDLFQRRYAEAATLWDRAIRLFPNEYDLRIERATIELVWRADSRPLREAIEAIVTENQAAATDLADEWLDLGLCERDPVTIDRALAAMKPDGDGALGSRFPRAWFEGLAARARGDAAAAHAAFASARVQAEAAVRKQPDHARSWSILGMIDAALGRKEEAIREGRRAVELFPLAKEPFGGAGQVQYLALIYAWTGEKDLALDQLAAIVKIPSNLNYGELRLYPLWDPLRGDARFEKIVADLAPKDISP